MDTLSPSAPLHVLCTDRQPANQFHVLVQLLLWRALRPPMEAGSLLDGQLAAAVKVAAQPSFARHKSVAALQAQIRFSAGSGTGWQVRNGNGLQVSQLKPKSVALTQDSYPREGRNACLVSMHAHQEFPMHRALT